MKTVYLNADKVMPVGSRVTCNPAPTDTDIDYLVFTTNPYKLRDAVFLDGYELGGSRLLDAECPLDSQDRFSSYTKGEVNLIVTSDKQFFDKFVVATHVAQKLNLLQKSDRITLFQAVLYGNIV